MEENRNQGTDFMKETIKQRPLNRKKLIRRTLITAAMAVIFGMVACITFLLLEPIISKKLYPEEEPEPIVLEEEPEEEEILPEDMIISDSQMNSPEIITPPILEDEQIAQVLSEMKLGAEDYGSLYNSLAAIARAAQKSMVTVVGVTSDVDWFNNVYESEGSVSGVIVADNGRELLILTKYDAIKDAEAIRIAFYNNKEFDAALKKRDAGTGYAIVSVLKSAMDRETKAKAVPISLGSSSGNYLAGMPIIALGQPMGVNNSICYGFITSAGNILDLPDSRYKWIATDIYGSSNPTGVLINIRGQVIGIIDTANSSSDTRNLIGAIGISELRKVIEHMSNDKDIPYFGVHGADVTEEVNEELGVPIGAYIKSIDMESPAMTAGIQSGDVIVEMADTPIATYQELISCVLELQPEETVSVKVKRQGPEGYVELTLETAVRAR